MSKLPQFNMALYPEDEARFRRLQRLSPFVQRSAIVRLALEKLEDHYRTLSVSGIGQQGTEYVGHE